MATSLVPASAGPPTPRRPRAAPVDPNSAALQIQLAAAEKRQQRNNKMTLFGLVAFVLAGLVVACVNWAMEGYSHAEKMACMELKKAQPQIECSYASGGGSPKPVTIPSVTIPKQAEPALQTTVPNDGIKTIKLAYGDSDWERPGVGSPIRICASAPAGKNLYPAEGTTLTGGKSIENGGTFIANGECVISKLKGGAS